MSTVHNYRKAIAEGIARVMRDDDTVMLLGEDVGAAGGAFKSTVGLLEEFGPHRVWDTPIAEQAIIGAAMGAAMTGLKPIAEIMFADFLGVCFDGIVNQVAKARYMSGGQVAVPMVIRMAQGGGLGFGAQHSQCVEGWLAGVPGLKVVAPSTPADLVGLMRSAVEDPDPVVFLEHKGLFDAKGEVPDGEHRVPLGVAHTVRRGRDVTVATLSAMVPLCLQAADLLIAQGIDAEVIDLRCLAPLDSACLEESIRRTATFAVVEESPKASGWGGHVISQVVGELFYSLDRPPLHIAGAAVPLPYAHALEEAALPSAQSVARLIADLVAA